MKEQEIEQQDILDEIVSSEYKYGFVSDIDQEIAPKGLNEDSIRLISSKKMNLYGCSNGVWQLLKNGRL